MLMDVDGDWKIFYIFPKENVSIEMLGNVGKNDKSSQLTKSYFCRGVQTTNQVKVLLLMLLMLLAVDEVDDVRDP